MALLLYQWWLVALFFLTALPSLPGTAGPTLHPFYVSVTEINHNSKEKTLEVICKAFADDMEDVLKKQYKLPVDLTNKQQEEQNNRLIKEYISTHLALKVDGRPAPLQYVGFEKESESVYCYFEAASVPALKKLEVTNSILQDLTDQQINIMHVTANGTRKSYKLDFPAKQASFGF